MVAAAGTFDVGAIGAIDDLNITPIGNHGIEFGLIKGDGLLESDGVGVVTFEGNVVFAGLEIGAEGATTRNDGLAIFGDTESAGEFGKGELHESLL